MAGSLLFANNATSQLSGAISNTATSVALQAGEGALFPNPSAGYDFVGTFVDAATGLLNEIVWCTARSGDTLTIVRAQEGTTALAWNAGDFFSNLWTAGQAAAIQTQIGSLVSFGTLAIAQAASVASTVSSIQILSYATLGDAPIRTMVRIATPSPVQPWHVQTADGAYWQDSGGDFWVEWLGATAANPNCATALNNAFLAHLNLGSQLRGKGNKACTGPVLWNTYGWNTRFCWADFNGPGQTTTSGMVITFANNVVGASNSYSIGAPFTMLSSTAQNTFYGKLKGLQVIGNSNTTIGQIGRTDGADPMNDFEMNIIFGNNSLGSSAAVLNVNNLYTSKLVYLQANGPGGATPGSQVALYCLRLTLCNQNEIEIAVGGYGIGLQIAGNTAANSFSGEIADNYIGWQTADNTCAYNAWNGGGINDNTYAIDNHLPFFGVIPASFTGTITGSSLAVSGVTGTIIIGQVLSGSGVPTSPEVIIQSGTGPYTLNYAPGNVGPEAMTSEAPGVALRIGGSTVLGGNSNIFYNNSASDHTWGGCGVLLDVLGTDYVAWSAPSGGSITANAYFPNLGAVPYSVSVFGSGGSAIEVYVRSWDDFSSGGFTVGNTLPLFNTIVGAGEKINVTVTGGTYTWAWKPLLTI